MWLFIGLLYTRWAIKHDSLYFTLTPANRNWFSYRPLSPSEWSGTEIGLQYHHERTTGCSVAIFTNRLYAVLCTSPAGRIESDVCRLLSRTRQSALTQQRNHSEQVEGDQGLGPDTGALALGVGRGRGRPLRLWGSGGYHPPPGKFMKTQMINPAFWWHFAFWKLRPRSWGTTTLLVPQPKRWGTSLPHGCCAYAVTSTPAFLIALPCSSFAL